MRNSSSDQTAVWSEYRAVLGDRGQPVWFGQDPISARSQGNDRRGLGSNGASLVLHFSEGYSIDIWNRTKYKCEPLAALRAWIAPTVQDAAPLPRLSS